MTSLTRRAALAAALLFAPSAAHAYPDGRITGRAMTGCNTSSGCHGTTAGASVEIMGPSSVAAGSTTEYTLVIRSSLATFTGGGFDMSVAGPAGTALATSASQASTRINNGDLVMSARLPASGGALTVRFNLVTPSAGTATIFAAGNATNGLGQSGDAWALTMFSVQVTGATGDGGTAPDVPTADVPTTADSGVRRDASGPSVEQYDPSYSMGYNRCSARPGAVGHGGLGAWALAALGLAAALRKRSPR